MHHVVPLARRERALRFDIGEVALNRDARRAEKIHHHLGGALLLAPTDDGAVYALGAKPRARRHRPHDLGIGRDIAAREHALAAREVARVTHNAARRSRALVFRLDAAGVISDGLVHMPNAAESVAFVEHRLAVRRRRGVRVAPVDAQFLARVASDMRDAHP